MNEHASDASALDEQTQRQLAKELFNHVWTLIELQQRTDQQTDEMIHAAHASRHHWTAVGTLANHARGEWLIARVYSTLGRAEPAVWHARRATSLAEQAVAAGLAEDWDLPAAFEGLARALALAGRASDAAEAARRARACLAEMRDPEDRLLIEQDLASLAI